MSYLIAINVNTRYLYAELTNIIENNENAENDNIMVRKDKKSTILYLKALQKMIDSGMRVKHLSGDGEGAFNSKLSWDTVYKDNDIDFKPVQKQIVGVIPKFMQNRNYKPKSEPMHSSLGIVDRVIRTIRDMAYNMKIGVINPNSMKIIVEQYNHAPHKTLSKYAGFEVSPYMAENNMMLEDYIVKKIIQSNFNIQNEIGYELPIGSKVSVYNEKSALSKRRTVIQPDNYEIEGFENGYYKIKGKNNRTQLVSRYKINPIY